MGEEQEVPELRPLADLDQVIHAPARLMVLTYLYVVESADYKDSLQQVLGELTD